MFQVIIFVVLFFLHYSHQQLDEQQPKVDYNRLVEWQRRTLYCAPSPDGFRSGQCYLTVGKEGTEGVQPKLVHCRDEKIDSGKELRFGEKKTTTRTLCNIECDGADRDSVISKTPSWNRQCIRYHTYNTVQKQVVFGSLPEQTEWWLWREGDCRLSEISLEVHCGFPQ
ncbi:hypothetical protein DdX_15899 [Ditylenchus destructor]|uniref:DUF7808 domain-containing protein n=1 Tax=Ditylenchus destructor TaxID=166010 RepID=A0AAD4R0F2_9BILA|nr:hypothetical protein DdX_15899 [Ditylenchus destructor]